MKSEYRKRLGRSALVLFEEGLKESKDYRIEVLKNNSITGIPSLTTGCEDGCFKLYYDITGRQPMTTVFSKKKLDRTAVSALIRGIAGILETAGEYLLEPDSFVFEPDYIFFEGEDAVSFVFFPDRQEDAGGQLHSLGEYLISHVDHGDSRAVKLSYGFFEATGKEDFTPEDIKGFCALDPVAVPMPAPAPVPEPMQRPEPVMKAAPEPIPERIREPDLKDCFDGPRDRDSRKKKGEKSNADKKKREKKLQGRYKKDEDEIQSIKKNAGKKSVVDYLIWIAAAGLIIWLIYDNFLRRMGTKGIVAAALLCVLAIDIIVTCIVKSRRKNKTLKAPEEKPEKEKRRMRDVPIMPEPVPEPVRKPRDEYLGTGLLREDSEKTGLLRESYEKTGLLSEHDHQTPGLIPALGNNKKPLFLTGFPFVVGKSLSYADGAIDDSYISRVHCRFLKEGSDYYCVDLNSTNGTSLNGIPLDPNREYPIHEGDEVRLGRTAYIFSMVEC